MAYNRKQLQSMSLEQLLKLERELDSGSKESPRKPINRTKPKPQPRSKQFDKKNPPPQRTFSNRGEWYDNCNSNSDVCVTIIQDTNDCSRYDVYVKNNVTMYGASFVFGEALSGNNYTVDSCTANAGGWSCNVGVSGRYIQAYKATGGAVSAGTYEPLISFYKNNNVCFDDIVMELNYNCESFCNVLNCPTGYSESNCTVEANTPVFSDNVGNQLSVDVVDNAYGVDQTSCGCLTNTAACNDFPFYLCHDESVCQVPDGEACYCDCERDDTGACIVYTGFMAIDEGYCDCSGEEEKPWWACGCPWEYSVLIHGMDYPTEDCYGVCNGNAVVDECGTCGGNGFASSFPGLDSDSWEYLPCNCNPEYFDSCGNCGGVDDSCLPDDYEMEEHCQQPHSEECWRYWGEMMVKNPQSGWSYDCCCHIDDMDDCECGLSLTPGECCEYLGLSTEGHASDGIPNWFQGPFIVGFVSHFDNEDKAIYVCDKNKPHYFDCVQHDSHSSSGDEHRHSEGPKLSGYVPNAAAAFQFCEGWDPDDDIEWGVCCFDNCFNYVAKHVRDQYGYTCNNNMCNSCCWTDASGGTPTDCLPITAEDYGGSDYAATNCMESEDFFAANCPIGCIPAYDCGAEIIPGGGGVPRKPGSHSVMSGGGCYCLAPFGSAYHYSSAMACRQAGYNWHCPDIGNVLMQKGGRTKPTVKKSNGGSASSRDFPDCTCYCDQTGEDANSATHETLQCMTPDCDDCIHRMEPYPGGDNYISCHEWCEEYSCGGGGGVSWWNGQSDCTSGEIPQGVCPPNSPYWMQWPECMKKRPPQPKSGSTKPTVKKSKGGSTSTKPIVKKSNGGSTSQRYGHPKIAGTHKPLLLSTCRHKQGKIDCLTDKGCKWDYNNNYCIQNRNEVGGIEPGTFRTTNISHKTISGINGAKTLEQSDRYNSTKILHPELIPNWKNEIKKCIDSNNNCFKDEVLSLHFNEDTKEEECICIKSNHIPSTQKKGCCSCDNNLDCIGYWESNLSATPCNLIDSAEDCDKSSGCSWLIGVNCPPDYKKYGSGNDGENLNTKQLEHIKNFLIRDKG